jgi:WD40 repeat protein
MRIRKTNKRFPRKGREDAEKPKPQIFAITKEGEGFTLSRRGFMKMAGAAAAASSFSCAGIIKGSGNLIQIDDCSSFKAHKNSVRSLAISRDGGLLASGSADHTIKLWSLREGKLLRVLEGHRDYVDAVGLSPDGKLLVSGGPDKTVRVWSLPEGNPKGVLGDTADALSACAFSPEGTLLATGDDDGKIKVWSLPEGTCRKSFRANDGGEAVRSLAVSSDGKILVTGGGKAVKLWSFPEGELIRMLDSSSAWANAVAVSPDGNLAASGQTVNEINLWSLPQGMLSKTLTAHEGAVSALVISPDGKLMASGSRGKAIECWSLAEGKLVRKIDSLPDEVKALVLSPDGKTLVAGLKDGSIHLWSLDDFSSVGCLYDPACTRSGSSASTYRKMGAEIVTLPCGSPIPPGAQCICNCVAGSLSYPTSRTICVCDTVAVPAGQPLPYGTVCVCNTVAVGGLPLPKGHTRQMTGNSCVCDTVCTCNSVCTCQSVCSCQSYGQRYCSCNSVCTCQSIGTGGHYWHPN